MDFYVDQNGKRSFGVRNEGVSKYIHTIKVSQTGTAAPVETILESTLSGSVWSRSAAGTYLLTNTGAFPAVLTVPDDIRSIVKEDGNKITIERTSDDVLTVKTYLAADLETPADGVLDNDEIYIEIYLA